MEDVWKKSKSLPEGDQIELEIWIKDVLLHDCPDATKETLLSLWREGRVKDMMISSFEQEKRKEVAKMREVTLAEGLAEGRAKGLAEGRAKGRIEQLLILIERKRAKGWDQLE